MVSAFQAWLKISFWSSDYSNHLLKVTNGSHQVCKDGQLVIGIHHFSSGTFHQYLNVKLTMKLTEISRLT